MERLKSYLKFCWRVLKEELPHIRGYKPMTKAWRVFWYLVGAVGILTILNSLLPIIRNHPHISTALGLLLVIVGLVVLIGFIKSFHERTTTELTDAHNAEISEWRTHTDKVYRLAILYGMALEADDPTGDHLDSLSIPQMQHL
jgi:hypothetical protein